MQGMKLGQGHTKLGGAITNLKCNNCGTVYNIKNGVNLRACNTCGMRMTQAVPPMR